MSEIYKVWATFNLRGDALQKMEKFALLAKNADIATKVLDKTFQSLSMKLSEVSRKLTTLNPELNKLSSSFSKIKIRTHDGKEGFNQLNTALDSTISKTSRAISNVDMLARGLSRVARNAEKSSLALASQEGGAMAPVGGGRRHRGHMHGFGVHAGGFGMFVNPLGVSPGLAGAVGAGMLLHSGFEKESEYQRYTGQLAALGYSKSEINQVNKWVNATEIKGVSKLDLMQAYIDAQMATRLSPSEAVKSGSDIQQLAPILAKTQFAAGVLSGGLTSQEEQNLIRFAEIMGGSSLERRKEFLDAAMQIMVSSGFSIRPTELRTFARQAGGAFQHLSPEALVGMEPILQEEGGAKMSTGLVTGLRQLITGTGSNFNKKQVNFLERIGLLSAQYDKSGRPLGVKMNKQYTKTAMQDPFAFMEDVILPLFSKAGIKSEEDISEAFTLGFGRTYSNVLQLMYKNREIVHRQLEQMHHIGGVQGTYEETLKMDNPAAVKLAAAAWSDFSKAIGELTSPAVSSGIMAIASALSALARFINFFNLDPYERDRKFSIQGENIKKMYSTSPLLKTLFESNEENRSIMKSGSYGTSESYGAYSRRAIYGVSDTVADRKMTPVTIQLNVDGKKMASAMMPGMTNIMSRGGVNTGTSYANIGLTPISVNYNDVGSP